MADICDLTRGRASASPNPDGYEIAAERTAGSSMSAKAANNGPDDPETTLPLYPDQRTSSDRPGMSQRCR
jgi:hypothetical protein